MVSRNVADEEGKAIEEGAVEGLWLFQRFKHYSRMFPRHPPTPD